MRSRATPLRLRRVAARRGLADVGRLLRYRRTATILLHPAVWRDRENNLVSDEHSTLPPTDLTAI